MEFEQTYGLSWIQFSHAVQKRLNPPPPILREAIYCVRFQTPSWQSNPKQVSSCYCWVKLLTSEINS